MIDTKHETLIPLNRASQHLIGSPHVATLHRWRLRGVNGVRLETLKVGGRRVTSLEALQRFIAGTTAAADGHDRSATPSEGAARKRHLQQVDAQLDRLGL